MKRRMVLALLSALAMGTLGCASGPKYGEMKSSIPDLSPENGRIFFYRSANVIGSGIQPSVKLNGNVVGESRPGGFF